MVDLGTQFKQIGSSGATMPGRDVAKEVLALEEGKRHDIEVLLRRKSERRFVWAQVDSVAGVPRVSKLPVVHSPDVQIADSVCLMKSTATELKVYVEGAELELVVDGKRVQDTKQFVVLREEVSYFTGLETGNLVRMSMRAFKPRVGETPIRLRDARLAGAPIGLFSPSSD